jgi:glycosyltransferase involved in cell wall biosynthesis
VGQRSGYKNFEKFIKAYSTSKSLSQTFNIICFGGGIFTTHELVLMGSLGIGQDTIMQISGGDQLLGYFYKNASAFVYPSLYEGFGIPLLEAMSQGCPVVCSSSSSIPEVVGNAGEFFDPMDISAITKSIKNVVFDEKRSTQLKLLASKQLVNFSWDKCAKETGEVYMRLLLNGEI